MMLFFRKYQYYQELQYIVAIIAVLTAITAQYYAPCRVKGGVISMIGKFNAVKTDMQLHYAVYGVWPQDTSQAASTGGVYGLDNSGMYTDVMIKNGAFSYTFSLSEPVIYNKTITLRPVIQQENPFDSIYWVAGSHAGEKELKIFGKDLTDIEKKYIPKTLM